MMNVHERLLPPAPDAGELIDGLAGPDDRLWPAHRWPPMRFDRGLVAGARGGHGPIRYEVAEHVPGERAVFRFTGGRLDGTHRFELWRSGDGQLLRHVLEGRARGSMRLAWPLAFRWLHDACVEDALDRAEAAIRGAAYEPRPLGAWVRLLRRLLRRRRRAPQPATSAPTAYSA